MRSALLLLCGALLFIIPTVLALEPYSVRMPDSPVQMCKRKVESLADGNYRETHDCREVEPRRHLSEGIKVAASSDNPKADLLEHLKSMAWKSYYDVKMAEKQRKLGLDDSIPDRELSDTMGKCERVRGPHTLLIWSSLNSPAKYSTPDSRSLNRMLLLPTPTHASAHTHAHTCFSPLFLFPPPAGEFGILNDLLEKVIIGPIVVDPFNAIDLQDKSVVENTYCCDDTIEDEKNNMSCNNPRFGNTEKLLCTMTTSIGGEGAEKILFDGVPLGQVWVHVDDINLSEVNIGDLIFTHRVVSDRRIEVDIELIDVGLRADLLWGFWLCKCSPKDSDWEGIDCTQACLPENACKKPEDACAVSFSQAGCSCQENTREPDSPCCMDKESGLYDYEAFSIKPMLGTADGRTSKSYMFATIGFEPGADEVLSRSPPRTTDYPACPDNFDRSPDPENSAACMFIDFDVINYDDAVAEDGDPSKLTSAVVTVANLAKPIVTGILEGVVEDTVMKDLVMKDLLVGLFNDLLTDLNPMFDKWARHVGMAFDPLIAEPSMLDRIAAMGGFSNTEQPKHKVDLFNFRDGNKYWGWVRSAVDGLINVEKLPDGTLPPIEDVTYDDIKLNGIMNGISEPKDSGLVKIANIDISVMNGTDLFTRHDLVLQSIYLGGLNTFRRANVLQDISDHTIENVLVLDKLSVEFDMRVRLWAADITDPSTIAQSSNDMVEEVFHISSLALENVVVDMKMLTAVDKYLAAGLGVGSIYDDPMGCVPTAFHEVNMTYLNITAEKFLPPVLSELIDYGTSTIINGVADFAFEAYGEMVLWLLPSMAQTTLRQKLSSLIEEKMQGVCKDPEPQGFIDFTKEKLIQSGRDLLGENLLSEDDPTATETVNKLIRDNTDGGNMTLVKDFNFSALVPLGPGNELGIEVSFWDVNLKGLDTIGNAILLKPSSPFVLSNYVEMANHPQYRKMTLELDLHIGLMNNMNFKWDLASGVQTGSCSVIKVIDGVEHYVDWGKCEGAQIVRNTIHLSLDMDQITLFLDMLLKSNKQKVKQLKLRELQSPRCWYGTLELSQINKFDLSFDEFGVGFDCLDCSSQGFLDAAESAKKQTTIDEMTKNFNRLAKKFTEKLMGTESSATLLRKAQEATAVCNCNTNPDVLANGPSGTVIQNPSTLPNGKQWSTIEECDAGVRIDPGYDSGIGIEVPDGVIKGAGVIAFYIIFRIFWKLLTLFLDVVRGGSRRQIFQNRRENKKKSKEAYNLFKHDKCLGFNPAVSMWMRISIPCLLWMCIGLFALSHTSVLASIDIKITLGGDVLDFKEFQIMMLQESLEAMWEAKVYSLFFILFGFSFLWPYIKLFSLLFTWFLPPWILSTASRGGAISMLDLLGKWSLIDIYVFALTMSAFLMHIYSPPAARELLGLSFYQIDLQVTPLLGLLASMIAGVVMPATNEVMILAHRDAVADTLDKAYAKHYKMAASTEGIGKGMIDGEDMTEAEGLQSIAEQDEIRESEMVVSGVNPLKSAQEKSQRRRSTWIDSGTDDVQGYRKGLVDTSYSLCQHVWENEGGRDRIALKKPGQALVMILCLIPIYFCWVGGTVTSWSFDRNGLVGILIDIGDDGMDLTDYSIWNVGIILVERSITSNFLELFTVYFFLVCCAVFAFIFPILQQLVMAYVWVKPMTLKQLKIWYFVIEVMSGWATMDVFMVSIIVCLMQIGMLSEFMIPPICQFLDGLVPYGFVDEKDMTCFYIEAYLGYGCLLMAIAVLTCTFTLQLVQGAALSAIEDRENRIKGVSIKSEINLGSSKKFKDGVWYLMSKMFICDLSIKEEFIVADDDTVASDDRKSGGLGMLLKKIGLLSEKASKKKGRKSRSKSKRKSTTHSAGDSFDDEDDDFDSDSDGDDDSSFQPAPPPRRSSVKAPPKSGLPPGWTEQTSENGTYYWNFQTGVTTWERPQWPDDDDDSDDDFVAPPPPPGGGLQMQDMHGRSDMA
jgi:hypothetical protein